ncbi:sulfotransferase [Moorena producens JHB]|uniref:Sulfotransferase n=1 Tax=Moorena producens (strain JHB) TaxID=1454205 RepID=A0A1D9G1U1_MOOP1|nr:sulfotransferase domain-containing protein [Moorena producens]AOY81588.1 sulfotransferase [Moorena producens JHB]
MATNASKPNFLCIGAQKAGTTWLYHNLKGHPQIWLPAYKEIHYFDEIHLDKSTVTRIERNRLSTLNRELNKKLKGETISYSYLKFLAHLAFSEVKDDQWYLALFKEATSEKAIGEITPAYSALPELGVKHIKSLLGDIKIIYLLRNPIKRAWSQVVTSRRWDTLDHQQISYEEWVDMIDAKYSLHKGHYTITITNYENYFAQEQILYLFYDDICLNPANLLQKVCDFLEIKYEETFFNSTMNSLFNNSPKMDIPEKVAEYLTEKYKEQEEFIIKRFQPASFKL